MPVNIYSCLHKNSAQIGSNSISFGEGNGTPLQYCCPENPMDRGACWAAVHRVAQSRTWLKWFSMHACIGEGNGTPLQCFFLENPRNRGAWWAAIYGVAQSRTRLKWPSSCSSSSSISFLSWQLGLFFFLSVFDKSQGQITKSSGWPFLFISC